MSDHLIWKNPAPDASAPREPTLSVETAAALRDDRLARALASERRVDELNARIRLLEQQLKTARAEERERCAKAIEPTYPRPCGCDTCDCHNYDDARDVAIWDEATRIAAAIRSLGEKE